MTVHRFCACGRAMYAVLANDGQWVFVCEVCDPSMMDQVELSES